MREHQFDRLTDARHEVRALKEALQEANARTLFKAQQSYYDGTCMGGIIGAAAGFVFGVFLTMILI